MKGNMFTNETDGRIQMILHFKLMQDNVWQEIAISTLYRRPFSTDPLFGFNSIDLAAFGCISSGLPKDVISHATTSDPPGVVKVWSCFSIFSSSKKCCPKLKRSEMKNVSSTRAGKKGGGQPGLKLQDLRRTRFPRQTVSLPWIPKDWCSFACFGIGNDWIGLSVGKQLCFLFFPGELGAVFFGRNYAILLPSDAELVGK